MKFCVAYTAVATGAMTTDFIARFVSTWKYFPPGAEADLIIICNGGPLNAEQSIMFSALNPRMFPRKNDEGFDLSGYQDAVRGPCADYDMVVFMGESCHFHREGWMRRFAEAWQKYPGFLGPFSSNNVRPHLQTTCFCTSPKILRQYPVQIKNRAERYEAEHGCRAIWRRVSALGMPVRLVTFDGEYEPMAWRYPPEIIYRGSQSNCLCWCNHSQGFAEADAKRKRSWSVSADRPFK